MTMKTILCLIFVGSSFLVSSAYACRCVAPTHISAYTDADIVVKAVVKDVIITPSGEGSTGILEVSQSWKSDSPVRLAVSSLTNCSFPWEKDKEYVLYLIMDSTGLYSTGRCLGNISIDDAKQTLEWLKNNGKSETVITSK